MKKVAFKTTKAVTKRLLSLVLIAAMFFSMSSPCLVNATEYQEEPAVVAAEPAEAGNESEVIPEEVADDTTVDEGEDPAESDPVAEPEEVLEEDDGNVGNEAEPLEETPDDIADPADTDEEAAPAQDDTEVETPEDSVGSDVVDTADEEADLPPVDAADNTGDTTAENTDKTEETNTDEEADLPPVDAADNIGDTTAENTDKTEETNTDEEADLPPVDAADNIGDTTVENTDKTEETNTDEQADLPPVDAADTSSDLVNADTETTDETVTDGEPVFSESMPAQDFVFESDEITVAVNAPEGAFPEGTTMTVELVDDPDVIDTINNAVEGESCVIKAVDITFYSNGKEVEPLVPIQVSLKSPEIAQIEDPVLVHVDDEGSTEIVEQTENTDEDEVSFESDEFSVYAIVGEPGEYARMTINFICNGQNVATVYVKNADDDPDQLAKIIFDPNLDGKVPDGLSFMGWTMDNPYTADSTRKTIDKVREDILAITNADGIIDGTVRNYYAALYKIVDVTYLGDQDVALGTHAFLRTPDEADEYFDYEVNMSYSPDSTHNFEGWLVREGSENIDGYTTGKAYTNETHIQINGSVVFKVNAPEGQWLVFHENKGTYVAPQFVKSQQPTQEPVIEMKRNGYSFLGWFADEDCTEEFEFGHEISERTHVYAGWKKNEVAPYMVICWTQNTNRTGYEVADSWVNENGQVGQNIQYTFVDNGSEDYVTGVGEASSGTKVYDKGHYLGFTLREDSKNQEVEITPEGDAVLNLYFDRIVYNFKFYLYRESGNGNNRYTYANNSGNGRTLNDLVTWHNASSNHPSAPSYTDQTETHTFNGTRYTYHYFTITAYYGQDISSIWPKYDQIQGADNRQAVSFVMMVGTKLKPNPTSTGTGTVKGIITVMNENILGATNDANGNYVMVRFPTSFNNWRYHIWFETVEGETYPEGSTYEYEGKTYYQVDMDLNTDGIQPLVVRSSNTDEEAQNEPKYTGFDYQLRVGQNNQGVWQESARINTYDENGHKVGTYWTTGNNPTLYHLNYIYNRQKFKISYFDGNYVGDTSSGENTIKNKAGNLLHESPEISYGAVIADEYRNYVPSAPEDGYVFEGWYLDEGCTVPYPWDTMPLDGITVYAKWHQVQYRAFLHPMAVNVDPDTGAETLDPTLDWGSEDQGMNFRISYLGQISIPFGTRKGYEFVGWFTAPQGGSPYNEETKLTDTNTVPYDKTDPDNYTDEMNIWGEGATFNKDLDPNQDGNYEDERFWIKRKIDLYGRWRKEIDGAPGIQLIYDIGDGTGTIKDDTLYKDTAHAAAQTAPTAPEGYVFSHWVVQTYNPSTDKFEDTSTTVYPGGDFEVLKSLSKVEVTEWKSTKDNTAEMTTEGTPAYFSGANEDITGPTGYPFISQANYTVQLRAEYIEVGVETPTHIEWYPNYGDNYAEVSQRNLQINEPTDIVPALERDGYRFLGWARVPTTQSNSNYIEASDKYQADVVDLDEDDLYLRWDGNDFHVIDPGKSWDDKIVTKVAADEITPYHDMYAVWERIVYEITIKKVVTGNMGDVNKEFTINVTCNANESFTYNGNTYDSQHALVLKLKSGQDSSQNQGLVLNVPAGVKLNVTEDTSSYVGYDIPAYTFTASGSTTSTAIENHEEFVVTESGLITVINNKDVTPDTGISLIEAPFKMLLALTTMCGAGLFLRKRRSEVEE